LLLLTFLVLHILVSRPGGWYSFAVTNPKFGDPNVGYYDATIYWKSIVALRSGQSAFATNWYPPTFLQVFGLVAQTSPEQAFAVWWLVVFSSYLLSVVLTYELLEHWHPGGPANVALAALMWCHNWPAITTMGQLQVNLLMLALLLVGYLGLTTQNGISALGVAAATLIKVSPVVVAAFELMSGRLRWVAVYVLGLALPVVVSICAGGSDLWHQFAAALAGKAWVSDSLDTAARMILPHRAAVLFALLCKVAIVTWAWLVVRRLRSAAKAERIAPQTVANATYAIACCCMLMVSPVIWPCHRVWFVPALLFAWSFCSYRVVPQLVTASALAIWLPTVPVVGVLSATVPGLLAFACVSPQHIPACRRDTAAAWLADLLSRRSRA